MSELHFSPTGALLTIGAALVWGIYSVIVRVLGTMEYQTVPLTCRIFRLRPAVPAHPGRNRGPACGNRGVGHAGASREPAVSRPARERDLLCDMEPRGLSSGAGAHERLHLRLTGYHHHASALVLHETMTPVMWLGTALALGGLMLSEKKPKNAEKT